MKTEGVVRGDSDTRSSVSSQRYPESILELKSEINGLANNIHSTYWAVLSQCKNGSTYYHPSLNQDLTNSTEIYGKTSFYF